MISGCLRNMVYYLVDVIADHLCVNNMSQYCQPYSFNACAYNSASRERIDLT